jgi:hypothetical protein
MVSWWFGTKTKSYEPVSQIVWPVSQLFWYQCTHSHLPGLKGEALFFRTHKFLLLSADPRLVQICIYKSSLQIHTHYYVNWFICTILYVQICIYKYAHKILFYMMAYVQTCIYKFLHINVYLYIGEFSL